MGDTVTLKSGETLTRPQSVERLELLAESWGDVDCEEICAHEVGDMLKLLLFVLRPAT